MRTIAGLLQAAAEDTNRYPLAKVLVEPSRMATPAAFAGDDDDNLTYMHAFDIVEMGDGSYVRARAGTVSGDVSVHFRMVEVQRITDVTDTDQWDTWPVAYRPGVTIALGSGLSLCADGSQVQLYYAAEVNNVKSLFRKVSLDYGATWGGAETVSVLGTGIAVCVMSSPALDIVFWARKYALNAYEIVASYLSGGEWVHYAAPYRKSWWFPIIAGEWSLSAIRVGAAGDATSNKYLIAFAALPTDITLDSRYTQVYTLTYSKPDIWSPVRKILPIDTYSGVSDFPEEAMQPRLSRIGDKYYCYMRRKIVQKSDLSQDYGHAFYTWSPDGLSWSLDDEYSILSEARAGSGRACFVEGDYFYEVGWSGVRRCAATYLVGNSSTTNISPDVPNLTLSRPGNSVASSAVINLFNDNGRYNNHAVVAPGSRVTVQGGYRIPDADDATLDVDSYTNIGTMWIDSLDTDTERSKDSIAIRCRDGTRKLKLKASEAKVYLSQARFQCDFDDDGDDDYFVKDIGDYSKWELDTINDIFQAKEQQQKNIALAGFYQQEGIWAYCKFRFGDDKTNANAGIVFGAQDTTDKSYYTVYYSGVRDQIVWARSEGVDVTGSVVLDWGNAKGWVADTWYWIAVHWHYGTVYAYSSLSGVIWAREFEAQDCVYGDGYVGLYAFPSNTTSDATVDFDEFVAVSLDTDWITEDVMRDAAIRCGVDDYSFPTELHDTFPGTTLDTTKWSTVGKTGSWVVDAGSLSIATGSGYLRSNASKLDFKMTWDMEICTASDAGGVFWRSDANVTNFYKMVVAPGATPILLLYEFTNSAGTLLAYRPLNHISINIAQRYSYTLSVQGKWISMWCDDTLLCSFYDDTITDEGYIGLAADAVTGVFYDNVRVPEFGTAVPLWTINPGDPYENTLRIMADVEKGGYSFDGDGQLVAYKDISGTSVLTFDDEIYKGRSSNRDLDWISVARVDGDDSFASYHDATLLASHGWRFSQFTIRELASADACYEAARLKVAESKRKLYERTFQAPAQLALEIWDRIRYTNARDGVDDDFVVTDINYVYQKNPPTLDMNVGIENIE